ncbi:CHASE2 domain-containing protein (plasmid) [Kovacikia minuta CCNUW1]|uniref:CHASE2 domain-containing protein n=1 Tax=Kovacikia minuta TaxID=2931930 RepID=UPI001CC9434F|nr:CHASE2 domain-containing protein [Kovacikia minuta]UBF29804.1 CHASE2 domain-containing protein [Kovacikia minuta CCNUW1]
MTVRSPFRLKVRQVEQSCVFDLCNPAGQEISATLRFPETLAERHQNWQQIYLRRYELQTRARVGRKSGSGTPTSYDWDQELRIAETTLLNELDYWLGQPELLGIREAIQQAVEEITPKHSNQPGVSAALTILLECSPLSLAQLPWETWKLVPPNVAPGTVRIARTCTTQVAPLAPANSSRRGKIRILAIFAAAPELNHGLDQKILRSLQSVAEIEFVQCQPTPNPARNGSKSPELKQQVAAAIADQRGWDVLFFAGHSNTEANTGGKLELAPQTTLTIAEIEPYLAVAKQRGLQLAMFNSCCGLQIAESLIRLGLPQVVVMREQIQDAVAHKFLEHFCHHILNASDVHTAVLAACQYFARENIAYPSAHLIPSLFCHPDPRTRLFRLEPSWLKRTWFQWRPTRWEAIAISTISLLSLMVPVQELLLEVRYWSQAVYRQTTHQFPPAASPPVTLLEIDQASIDRKGIDAYKVKPMSRAYLAELGDRLRQLQVRVIGFDYLLDGSTNEDATMAATVQAAIRQQTWLVFATRLNDAGQAIGVTSNIAKPDWILQGNIDIVGWDVMLPATPRCDDNCPFAYQLALAQVLRFDPASPQPQLKPSGNLQNHVSQYLEQVEAPNQTLAFLKQPGLPLGLQPMIDFSLPPAQVYRSIAAWDFLERPLSDPTLQSFKEQVVIIGSGGYDQADDNFPLPLAVRYWRSIKNQAGQQNQTARSQVFPGATAHAYSVHHLLAQHRLLGISNLWLIGIAAILGKGMAFVLMNKNHRQQQLMVELGVGGTLAYALIGLQIYISALILLPWLLPSALFWLYILPNLRRSA